MRTGDTHACGCPSQTCLYIHRYPPTNKSRMHPTSNSVSSLTHAQNVPQTLHTPTHTQECTPTHVYTQHPGMNAQLHVQNHTDTYATCAHSRTPGPQTSANTFISTKKHVHTFTNIHKCTLRQKPGTRVHTC